MPNKGDTIQNDGGKNMILVFGIDFDFQLHPMMQLCMIGQVAQFMAKQDA